MSLTRRAALQVLAAGAAVAGTVGAIDTHVHFYDPARPEGVPWPDKAETRLYRTVLPPEFERIAAPLGVTSCLVVEASPWLRDNDWILALAAQHPVIRGFVGNTQIPRELRRLARNPLFRGIRLGEQALVGNAPLLTALSDLHLTLDVLGGPSAVARAAALARNYPQLRIVIDHLPIPGSDLAAVSRAPNVFAKVSGDRLSEQSISPVWDAFGPNRLLYASNFPVSGELEAYAARFRLVQQFFARKGPEASSLFFRANAETVYRTQSG